MSKLKRLVCGGAAPTFDAETAETIHVDDAKIEVAIGCLRRAAGDRRYAKWLGRHVKAGMVDFDPHGLAATFLVAFIPRALTDPGGNIEAILKKCGLLDPDFIKSLNLDFSGMGQH